MKLAGIPAAPGFAKGPLVRREGGALEIPRFQPENLEAERERLAGARRAAAGELHALAEKVKARAVGSEPALFEAQAMFLDDPALLARAEAAIAQGQNAELAWHEASEFFAGQLEGLPDATLRARAADVRDVSRRVIGILAGAGDTGLTDLHGILVARDLAPSETAGLDPANVIAFCTAEGGPTSHSAILARALGIPAVVGLGESILAVEPGTLLLVDGAQGEVWVAPDAGTMEAFGARMSAERALRARYIEQAEQPALTRDGQRVEVAANIGNTEDARAALKFGAEGVGLLRTEFLYLQRQSAPSENEQYEAYRAIFEVMGQRPVVVRTMDIGGDKPLPYLELGKEENPFLGWRAVRISLSRPDLFQPQLRALLRAGAGHDLRIMFPMVATLEEIRAAKAAVLEARQALTALAQPAAEKVQLGMMVEIPSAALMADAFVREVNFFSIGTNDLTQYTLAAERTNKKVAYLGDAIHPSVLRLIRLVSEAAHAAGRWVGVCGELGGDPEAVPVLLGLGVDELSVAPPFIPEVKAIVRAWSSQEAAELASEALALDTAPAVRQKVRDRTR
jgi:phosphoenolpyruvate-protein phosphotransferase